MNKEGNQKIAVYHTAGVKIASCELHSSLITLAVAI